MPRFLRVPIGPNQGGEEDMEEPADGVASLVSSSSPSYSGYESQSEA
jgi:hypothetical protein